MPNFETQALLEWFKNQKRPLPWRNDPSPYAVWVSEVMLQQTQVAVVIPYFERWMKRFPTVKALAESALEDVIKHWEGLGYYARAKNLHAGAKQVVQFHGGNLPSDEKSLSSIKGLGPYTIGAIRAFAFHEKSPAVDGNVLRFLTRYFAIEEDIAKLKTQKKIAEIATDLLPENEPWVFAEALIEFGATVCKKVPLCDKCPLHQNCASLKKGLTKTLPVKKTRVQIVPLYRAVAVILHQNRVLIKKIPEGQIMGGLHEFPYIETGDTGLKTKEFVTEIMRRYRLPTKPIQKLSAIPQNFTRYQVRLDPVILSASGLQTPAGFFWATYQEAERLPFSSGHRRVLNCLKQLIDKQLI